MLKRLAAFVLALGIIGSGEVMAQTQQVTGSVTYLERMALPPEAKLKVSLQDVSLQDVPAKVISQTETELKGVPAPFSLPYDADQILPNHTYSVRAQIVLDDRLLFSSTSFYPVLTNGAGDTADIIVKRANMAQTNILGTEWTVVSIGDQPITLARMPTISFGKDGKVSVFGGCNRFMGQLETNERGLGLSDKMAGTLMACSPELDTLERHLLTQLQNASVFNSNGQELTIMNADHIVLVRARAGI